MPRWLMNNRAYDRIKDKLGVSDLEDKIAQLEIEKARLESEKTLQAAYIRKLKEPIPTQADAADWMIYLEGFHVSYSSINGQLRGFSTLFNVILRTPDGRQHNLGPFSVSDEKQNIAISSAKYIIVERGTNDIQK